ncbi:MAG TPA: hypothetical protein VHZ32_01025 [Rhizomicrobium sp.]|nr:hypothetical protein [Rhizomicrobium sp.]
MDKRWTLTKRADQILWQQCIGFGMAAGALAGWPLHWHGSALIGIGMILGVFAGVGAFYLIRRWR